MMGSWRVHPGVKLLLVLLSVIRRIGIRHGSLARHPLLLRLLTTHHTLMWNSTGTTSSWATANISVVVAHNWTSHSIVTTHRLLLGSLLWPHRNSVVSARWTLTPELVMHPHILTRESSGHSLLSLLRSVYLRRGIRLHSSMVRRLLRLLLLLRWYSTTPGCRWINSVGHALHFGHGIQSLLLLLH